MSGGRVAKGEGLRRGRGGARSLLAALSSALLLLLGAVALGPRYTDPDLGFTIRAPEGWKAVAKPAEGVSVAFLGPRREGFTSNLTVVVIGEPIEATVKGLGGVVRDLERRMNKAEGVRDYHVLRSAITGVGGVQSIYLEASFEQRLAGRFARFKQLQTLIPGPGGHSVLTYTARAEDYEAALAEAQTSMNSYTAPLEAPGGGPPGWRGLAAALAAILIGGAAAWWFARRGRAGRPA